MSKDEDDFLNEDFPEPQEIQDTKEVLSDTPEEYEYEETPRRAYKKPVNNGRKGKSSKARQKLILTVVLLGVVAVIFCLVRIMPTKEKMSGYEYFNITEDSQGNRYFILMDGEKQEETALMQNERLYFPRAFVVEHLNKRFYYDKETGGVIKTDGQTTYTFPTGQNGYTDGGGQKLDTTYPVVIEVQGELYVDAEFAYQDGAFVYRTYMEPQRVVVTTDFSEKQCVTVTKDTQVRCRGGIKSPILEEVQKEQRLYYRKDVDEWMEVLTESGFVGYVKKECISEKYAENEKRTAPSYVETPGRSGKICLSWYQVTNSTANRYIDDYLTGVECTNVVSPTWFSVLDNEGGVSQICSQDFVDKMHRKGIQVWALADDFSENIDRDTFLESRSARSRLINTLVNTCKNYGIDGLNIDFEKVNAASAPHYLQFLRELSLVCRKNNLILSTDNYRPYAFNSFYQVGEQADYVDYLMLMGYDEHYSGSDAGSVASLPFVAGGVEAMLAQDVPAQQLVLGMPFYTRIWTESGGKTTSRAVGMQNALDNLSQAGAIAQWDESQGQYFGSYIKDNEVVKIWLEEDKSIEEKLKVMAAHNLAGCAQWKLGLEKKSVWSVIDRYIR